MTRLLRLLIIGGLAALAVLAFAIGLAQNSAALLGPTHLLLFLLGLAVYLLPTGLALYRECEASAWIAAVNVLFGWTFFGWFIAIGWAAVGKMQTPDATISLPPRHNTVHGD